MTSQELATLHAAAFAPQRGWTAKEFADLLSSRHVQLFHEQGGFALVRAVAGEAELLTLAVAPDCRRKGIASALMKLWMGNVSASRAFLEVAADNEAAIALYRGHGFAEIGRRPAYYRRSDGTFVDALLMQAALSDA